MNTKARNVAIGSIVITMLSIGSALSLPIYLVPLSELFNVSISQVVFIFSLQATGGLISSLLFGQLLKRVKVKVLVSIAGVVLAVFFCSIFFGKSLMLIYMAAILYGFATVFAGFAIAQTEITWWFMKGRAKIMSYLNIGLGIFGLVFMPIIAKAIGTYGVQNVALLQGVISGGLIIVIAFTMLCEHPDTYGLRPEGYAEQEVDPNNDEVESNLSIKEMLKVPAFWMIIVSIILVSTAFTGFLNNSSALFQNMGLDAMAAALCLSIFNGVQLIWVPIYGVLVDKIGPGVATAIYGIIAAATFFIAIFLTGFVGAMIIAVLISSLNASGMIGPTSFPVVFGTKEAGTLVGFANAAASVGGMIGAPIAGLIFDSMGSYNIYLVAAGVACILMVVLTMKGTSKKAIESVQSKEAELVYNQEVVRYKVN